MVISDINLGEGINGFKFLDLALFLLDNEISKKCLWIIMSSDYEISYQDKARELGAIFLPKDNEGLFRKAICGFLRQKLQV